MGVLLFGERLRSMAYATGDDVRRFAARHMGVDWSYWRRLTRGERCPSVDVAERVIAVMCLDDDVAAELLNESVEREPPPPGRRGRVIRSGP